VFFALSVVLILVLLWRNDSMSQRMTRASLVIDCERSCGPT
jgi:hypothetical protein